MNRAARYAAALIHLALVTAALGVRAESDHYCFDHLRSVEDQLRRADAAKCSIDGAMWSRDTKTHFEFCRANDASNIQYRHQQRESYLTYCEVRAKPVFDSYPPENVRISGGPGDYTVHWTIRTRECRHSSGFDSHCFVQIRFETPPGRPGAFARQLRRYERPSSFTEVRADRYAGQPGDVVTLKWQACLKGGVPSASCEGFKQFIVVMPPGIPEFRPARIVEISPNEYTPDRFKRDTLVAHKATGDRFQRFHVRLDGTKDPFMPAAFQDGQGWKPVVWLRFSHGGKELLDKPLEMDFPANGLASVALPASKLNNVQCLPNVGVTGLCGTVDVEVESIRHWTTGNVTGLQESMGKSRGQLRLVNPVAAIGGQAQSKGPMPRTEALAWPASIISQCNASYRSGTVTFAARQSNVDGHPVPGIPVELEFSHAGQGAYKSPLLTNLPAVPNSDPAEYRSALSVAQLTRHASTWRWRVKAVEGERTSEWCSFTVAEPQSTAAATVPAKLPGAQSALSVHGAPSGASPSATTPAPMLFSAPRGANGTDADGSRQINAPANIGAPSAPRAAAVTPTGPAQVASLGKLEVGVNRVGGDYRNQPAVATAQACQTLCMGDGQCKAWTWVTAEKRCWLKSSVPVASKGDCCTSGVK